MNHKHIFNKLVKVGIKSSILKCCICLKTKKFNALEMIKNYEYQKENIINI